VFLVVVGDITAWRRHGDGMRRDSMADSTEVEEADDELAMS